MQWSRYNTLFHSGQFGHFLYNALSNTLIELDKTHYLQLEEFRNGEDNAPEIKETDFSDLLHENRIFVETGEERRQLLCRQYRRHSICYDSSRLGLTICPTLQCNFRCPYCFENSQQDSAIMSPDTISRLISFIKSHKDIRHLSIAWYGGEPLLAFDVMCEVTEKVKALDLDCEGVGIITNGYLLDSKKIARLNELNINSIQITLDGLEQAHNKRRMLAGGGSTFQCIMNNIDTLMNSTYAGACTIRVNIDRRNLDQFVLLRSALLEKFKGKKLSVYAGQVNTGVGHSYDSACNLDLHAWKEFTLEVLRQSGQPTGGFYPGGNLDSICVATTHNGFVVGPAGELYKCWEDVGKQAMAVGSIHQDTPVTNPELQALYCLGTDAYSDPECLECEVLPICGGGCANKRLRAKQFSEKGLEFCSAYKDNLTIYLEAYIDYFRSMEITKALLRQSDEKQNHKGFRVISPEKNKI
jgi:uncharacterized protein